MPYPSLRYVRDNSPSLPIVLATLVGILSLVLAVEMGWLFRKKLDVKGKVRATSSVFGLTNNIPCIGRDAPEGCQDRLTRAAPL